MSNRTYTFILLLVTICAIYMSYNNTLLNKKLIKAAEKEVYVVPDNIVFVGDSITEFYDLSKFYDDTTYMVNSGIGATTAEEYRKILKEKIYQYNPSKVFILIGTNDIQHGETPDEIVGYIKEMVDGIKEVRPMTEIYVESILPTNKTEHEKINRNRVGLRTNETIRIVNEKIEALCKEEKVTYIDMFNQMIDEQGQMNLEYTREGLHLTEEGYKKVTEILKEYV